VREIPKAEVLQANTDGGRNMIQSFRDLDVWKKSMTLAEHVYVVTQKFPRSEEYGLTSQMRRAAGLFKSLPRT